MKNAKKITSIILALVLLLSTLSCVTFPAFAITSGNYQYTVLSDGTARLGGYTGIATVVDIPSEIDGYTVTAIGAAFRSNYRVKSVTIPNTVTSIEEEAFRSCTSLTSITIPDSVTNIGRSAFNNCQDLAELTIGNSVTNIGDFAFDHCCSLTSIIIPNSVITIGGDAFQACTGLTTVNIPSSVTSLGQNVFGTCSSLTDITVDSDNANYSSQDGVLFNKDKTELIRYPQANERLSYTLPSSVKSLSYQAFSGCLNLAGIIIPNSVTSIGEYAFSGCHSLTNITIPDSVKSIGKLSFYNCESLMSIAIPDGLTSLEVELFDGCSSLTSIAIPDSVKSVAEFAFNRCAALKDIYYTGTNDQWKRVSISSANGYLNNAEIHYECEAIVTAPTCTEQGYTTYSCPTCENSFICNYVDATGHSYDNGKITKEATYTETGIKTYTCTGCGATKTETIAKKTLSTPKLSSVANAAAGVKITWGEVADATMYRVFYKANGESSWHKAADTTSTSYTWTGAKSGTKYTFTVRCVDKDGNFISNYDTAGLSITYVAAPKLSTVSNAATGVTITWGKVTGATMYRVFYKANGASSWSKIADTTSTSYTWTGAKSGTKYTFTVRCVDKDGNFISNYDTAGLSITYVAAPKLSTVSNATTGVTIAWGKVTGATNYRVFYKANGESNWHKAADTTSTSYTWIKAVSGTKYAFTVRCVDKDGNFISNYDTAGLSITYVAAPKLSSVANAATGVTITWGKVTGATMYRVFYKANGESSWHKAADTTSTSYTWTKAESGTKYTFTVRCVDKDGNFISNYDTAGLSISYIAAPKLSSVSNAETGVKITWDKVAGAEKYRVFYKTSDGSWKKIADTTSTSYTWTGAKSGTKYTFTVRCVDKDGNFTSAYDSTGKSITR